jgi:excisionase family DNA binding protein
MSERKPEPTGEFLDPKSFARMVDLHRETIYRAIANGDLIAVKIRGAIRLPRAQLDSLLIDGSRDADNQAEQDEW